MRRGPPTTCAFVLQCHTYHRADVPMSAPNDASSAETQPRRQPRIFAIPPAVPISAAKVEPAAEPKQIRRKATTKRGQVVLAKRVRSYVLAVNEVSPAESGSPQLVQQRICLFQI